MTELRLHDCRRVGLGLIVTAALGGAMLADGPALASGETGGSAPGTSECPSSNPPNQMTLVAGTPQTTILQTAFVSNLQVALTNSDGCSVNSAAAGTPVTFSAPSTGASGVFSASGSNAVTVGADASGTVAAPTFTANGTAGSYTLTARSQYGSVSFSLTNTAAGIPARITAIALKSRSVGVTARYPQPLQVKVLDLSGNPVAGATVTFTLGSGHANTCGTGATAGASFTGGGAQATAITGASGLATSPLFTAGSAAGSFTATATLSSREPSSGSGRETPTAPGSEAPAPVSFALSSLAGEPRRITLGVGSTQSTLAGRSFPIRLAVTVTDAEKNPVPGAQITFSAPARGPSGRFTTHSPGSRRHRSRVSHPDTVKVETNPCGIAVAPAFTANDLPGGYIVKAAVKYARPAAFALVNEAPGQQP
jgi:hypothetical protein